LGRSEAKEALGDPAASQYLTIARILRPQGRKGEVAAEILTDFPQRFEHLRSVLLEVPGQVPTPVRVEAIWPHKGRIILKFAGIDSIDGASGLRGLQVLIPWEERTQLSPNQYYTCELVGCKVIFERQGREIGKVTEVEATGGVDVLHVSPSVGKDEVLIPLAQEICTKIDPVARVIVIDPPDDLLDLNEKGSTETSGTESREPVIDSSQ
jgi:16S rRNA processing protein RimM